jgi:hypothetical protein
MMHPETRSNSGFFVDAVLAQEQFGTATVDNLDRLHLDNQILLCYIFS